MNTPCSVENCERRAKAKGMCGMHHMRARDGRSMNAPPVWKKNTDRDCSVSGCDRPHGSHGYCQLHARRVKATGSPGPVGSKITRKIPGARCSVDGCSKPEASLGLCGMHYQRQRKKGHHGPAAPLLAPSGAGSVDCNGYRVLSFNNVRIMEHRYVMEQALGRPLWSDENVHHINGDRLDNRLENLELWSTSQPSGQRIEDKLAWAELILARYGRVTA